MSLDHEDPKLIKLRIDAVKGRSDFMTAVQTLHLAIVVAIQTLDEDPEQVEVRDRFASALEVAASHLGPRLSDDERDQYHRLYKYFQEMLEITFGGSQ